MPLSSWGFVGVNDLCQPGLVPTQLAGPGRLDRSMVMLGVSVEKCWI
jgi:hypothetical protein